jgi:hypothetical protein
MNIIMKDPGKTTGTMRVPYGEGDDDINDNDDNEFANKWKMNRNCYKNSSE